ncbi:hypothetical protein T484DRAFT_1792175 [Baffinella frigidus]|nr:hypothetical protein T484DRAFT_1792175 [Cryptophyta sp. CCMP2293]
MASLKTLVLSDNKLKEFSLGLMRLTSLTTLQMGNNNIEDLPSWAWKLTKLSSLNMEGNPLSSPPDKVLERGTRAVLAYLQLIDRSRKTNTLSLEYTLSPNPRH